MKLNLNNFYKMTPIEKDNAVKELLNGPAKDVKELEIEIMKYESVFDMSSQELEAGLKNGILTVDKEILHWLFLLDTVKLLNGK